MSSTPGLSISGPFQMSKRSYIGRGQGMKFSTFQFAVAHQQVDQAGWQWVSQ